MRTIRDILQEKGFDIYAITPESSVFQALQLMAEKNVGALMVMTGDTVEGLISERDYARKIVLKGRLSRDVPVREIMSPEIVAIGPEEDVERCMTLMTHKRVRHLPVFENERLIGLISIGDIVKAIIEHKEETIRQLEKYIKGGR
ncbi:MAG: CBS domain-containing protein [Desulfobacterales bacterium]|nr:CBS domain-containing protein [Desulfobacterales bacterium]